MVGTGKTLIPWPILMGFGREKVGLIAHINSFVYRKFDIRESLPLEATSPPQAREAEVQHIR